MVNLLDVMVWVSGEFYIVCIEEKKGVWELLSRFRNYPDAEAYAEHLRGNNPGWENPTPGWVN